jgi:hypothetical protein
MMTLAVSGLVWMLIGACLVIVLLNVTVLLWAMIDAVRRPVWVWKAAGRSKWGWVGLFAAGMATGAVGVGTAIAVDYLWFVRPRLLRVQGYVTPSGEDPTA